MTKVGKPKLPGEHRAIAQIEEASVDPAGGEVSFSKFMQALVGLALSYSVALRNESGLRPRESRGARRTRAATGRLAPQGVFWTEIYEAVTVRIAWLKAGSENARYFLYSDSSKT